MAKLDLLEHFSWLFWVKHTFICTLTQSQTHNPQSKPCNVLQCQQKCIVSLKVEDIDTHSVCQLQIIGTQGRLSLDWHPVCVPHFENTEWLSHNLRKQCEPTTDYWHSGSSFLRLAPSVCAPFWEYRMVVPQFEKTAWAIYLSFSKASHISYDFQQINSHPILIYIGTNLNFADMRISSKWSISILGEFVFLIQNLSANSHFVV